MASSKPVASPGWIQRSYDRAASIPAAPPQLRKEKSSPAVVQRISSSLVRNVVTASGQGAAGLFCERRSNAAVWRTRSVRNKHESYCILQLKQPTKGLAVQVTFLSPATTPREIRLLHAVVATGPFKPLAAQHSSEAISSERVRHSLTVNPNVQVQRFLKVEMNGQAVPTASGTSHAVCQLNILQMSAMTASSAANARQLPVPAPESPASSAAEPSAVVADCSGMPQAESEAYQPVDCSAGGHAEAAAAASIRHKHVPSAAPDVSAAVTEQNTMFDNWLSQTRSSIQHSRAASSSTQGGIAEAMLTAQQHQRGPQQQKEQHQQQSSTQSETAAGDTLQQCQLQQQAGHAYPSNKRESSVHLQMTVKSNRQQFLQLQHQHQLRAAYANQQQQSHGSTSVSSQHLLAGPRLHCAGHAAAAVLSAAGRPSTVLSMLQRSESWSQEDTDNSNITDSIDSAVIGDASCMTQERSVVETRDSQMAQDGHNVAQQQLQVGLLHDESGVLLGSVTQGLSISDISCQGPHADAEEVEQAISVDRCGSSCSVRGPTDDQEHFKDAKSAHDGVDSADEASSICRGSTGYTLSDGMRQPLLQMGDQDPVYAVVKDPELTDSNNCMLMYNDSRQPRDLQQHHDAVSPLSDRKVQSCPAICPLLDTNDVRHAYKDGPSLAAAAPKYRGQLRHLTASSVSSQQCMPSGTQQQAGLGVTLSPEVLRRGQLVKQSCPTLSFPRYQSHSPAHRSREGHASVADIDVANRHDIGDAPSKRSRLGSASRCRAWEQKQQQADSRPLLDAAEDVENVAWQTHAPDALSGYEAVGLNGSAADCIRTQNPLGEAMHSAQNDDVTAPSGLTGGQLGLMQQQDPVSEITAAATVEFLAERNQQGPAQNTLLQALLFSSCDFSSSQDVTQSQEGWQAQQVAESVCHAGVPAGCESPQKVQQLGFLPQAGSTATSVQQAGDNNCLPQAAGGSDVVNLSPIAESSEVVRLYDGITDAAGTIRQSPAGGEPSGLQTMSQVMQRQLCLVPSQHSASASSATYALADAKRAPQQQQQQYQQWQVAFDGSQEVLLSASCVPERQSCGETGHIFQTVPQQQAPPGNQADIDAADTASFHQQVAVHSNSGGRDSFLRQSTGTQFPAVPLKAEAVAMTRGIAEDSEVGHVKLHTITCNRISSSKAGHKSTAGKTAAGTSIRSSCTSAGVSGTTAKQRAEQQHAASGQIALRASSSIRCSNASQAARPVGPLEAAALQQQCKESSSSKQQPSILVRSSHVKLAPYLAHAQAIHSSSSTSSVKNFKPAAPNTGGFIASAKGRETSKYEQLLRSQFGKAPVVKEKVQSKAASGKARLARRQREVSESGPLTTSLNVRELLAATADTAAVPQHGQHLPAAYAAVSSTELQDQGVADSRVSVQEKPHQPCSTQHWHGSHSQQDELSYMQPTVNLHASRQAKSLENRQCLSHCPQKQQQQQQQHGAGRISGPRQTIEQSSQSTPASPKAQLNIFLPKLMQPELLTPRTAEHPGGSLNSNTLSDRCSIAADGVERGPTPNTPPWLGMASPKSGSKQHQQQQQTHEPVEQQIQQRPHLHDMMQGGHVQALWSAADVKLENSVDAAMEAASESLRLPCNRNTKYVAGSVSNELCYPQGSAAAGVGSACGAAEGRQMQSADSSPAWARIAGKAQPMPAAAPTTVAVHHQESSSTGAEPAVRKYSMIASHVTGGGTAIAASYRLQTSGQVAPASISLCKSPLQAAPSAAPVSKDSNAEAAALDPCNCSTVVVSIVKHCGGAQQQQVQLQQQYVFETQDIQDVVLLHVTAGADSCASCTSSVVAADVSSSVEAKLHLSQYKLPGGSPTSTEMSVAAVGHQPLAGAGRSAAAVAEWEEVASSNEPGPAAAMGSPGMGADSQPVSPGSCSSAVSNSKRKENQVSGLPQHLQRQGQARSRLGLQQLVATNAAPADDSEVIGAADCESSYTLREANQHTDPALQQNFRREESGQQGAAGDLVGTCCDDQGGGNDSISSSQQSFLTASSQRGTVWPHAGHQHHANLNSGDEASANASLCGSSSSTSSVSDTGLRGRQADSLQGLHDVEEARALAGSDAAVGVTLARNYYHSVSHQRQHSVAAGSHRSSQHSSHGSVATSHSSSAAHSLWDETDPLADANAPAAIMSGNAARAATAASAADTSCPLQSSQRCDMPHRVRRSSAGVSSSSAVEHSAACGVNLSSFGGSDKATDQPRREVKQAVCNSLDRSSASEVSVVSAADSAASAAGPMRLDDAGAASVCKAAAEEGQAVTEPDQQIPGASAEGAASTSLSFAAMHQAQPGYSSVPSGPGTSVTGTSNPPSCPAAANQATALLPACHSQDGSVGSNDAGPVQPGPSQRSLNDLGVVEGCKATGSKLDQSPTKQPARDQSASKQASDKALATADTSLGSDLVTAVEGCHDGSAGSAARSLCAVAVGQQQDIAADDAASISSRGSGHCKPVQVQHWLDQHGQLQNQLSSLLQQQQQQQQQQALSSNPQHSSRPRPQSRLQVEVPGSPQMSRVLASLVNFSPLHAGRSSRGSCCSVGQTNITPGKQSSAKAPVTENTSQNPAAAAVLPAFCSTAAAGVSSDVGAAATAAACGGPAKQSSAGSMNACAVFSPLHSMKPGSGSVGRVSSKTHSRTKQGSSSQDDEVSVVCKNLMDDMLKVAPGDGDTAVRMAGAAGKQTDHQLDTHGVRDSRHGAAVLAWEAAAEQPSVRLPISQWPQKGSVLSSVALPTLGASPMQQHQQQPHSLASNKSSDMAQSSAQLNSEQSSMQLQVEPNDALTAEQTLHSQWSARTSTDSGGAESIQLMSQSSAAAAAALRAAAATPAPIPCHNTGQAAENPQTPGKQQHATNLQNNVEVHASLAVLSLDGCIPPLASGSAAQPSSVLDMVQASTAVDAPAAGSSMSGSTIKQHSNINLKLSAGPLMPPSSEGRSNRNASGPLASGLLRRGNSLGSLSRMLAVGMPPINLATPASPQLDQTEHAAVRDSDSPAGSQLETAADQNRAAVAPGRFSPSKLQHTGVASSPAGSRLVSSPYLQQLEEHSSQQQQQQQLVASPLSAFRHNLPRKDLQQQQQQQQFAFDPASTAAATDHSEQASSWLPMTPSRSAIFSQQHTGNAVGLLPGVASGQHVGMPTRGTSWGGRMSPTPGSNSGAARMGRFRHRRARSDMPEYYPLSPLESPLHTAMPEDTTELCELTLSPQVSAAAVAAIAAAEEAAATGVGKLQILYTGGEPLTSPLGSPLRHGLTSPAAMYRIQQQQLKEQTSQLQLGVAVEQSAELSEASPAVSREQSKVDLQQEQRGVAEAVADAVAAYEGSISPRRLARIQEYVSGLLSSDAGGGSILDQQKPPSKAVPAVIAAGTPGKESDALDSFNLNNQPNFQAELEQHGQQLEEQTEPQDQQCGSPDALHGQQQQQQQKLDEVLSQGDLSSQQQGVTGQQQSELSPRHELSDVLCARLSQCSSSTVRASIEALLATKLRVDASINSNGSSRSHLAAANAAAGEGQCAAAVAQLLRGSQQVHPLCLEHAAADAAGGMAQQQRAAEVDSSHIGTNSDLDADLQHSQQQQATVLTSARLAQHSIASNTSNHSSNQRYPLNAEPSYASSAAAAQEEPVHITAGSRSVLSSVHELPHEPALLSDSTESMSLQVQQHPDTEQQPWLDAECSASQVRQSTDSQQVAVMQSHGALLSPGPAELSTAAGGAAADISRPVMQRPLTTAAAPARHALAGGMFRRSAQLLAGLAQGLMAPGGYDSLDSTAGSTAVGSRAAGSSATCEGFRALRSSRQVVSGNDEEFAEQLRASVNLVAGSLDISGPQVVRLTQQLWLNRLVPGTVPEEELTEPTAAAATAGSSERSAFTGSAGTRTCSTPGLAEVQQHQQDVNRRQMTKQHTAQKASAAGNVIGAHQQMGPLLAGRLAAMAAMRQLRRSSVGESPDTVADSSNNSLNQSSRQAMSVLAAAKEAGYRQAADAAAVGLRTQGSYTAPVGTGIGRGRLTAAEAAASGALTSSNSFGSGGVPGYQGELSQHAQQRCSQGVQRGQMLARSVSASMTASAASIHSSKDVPCEQASAGCLGPDDSEAVYAVPDKVCAARPGEQQQLSLHNQASDSLEQLLWEQESSS